MYYYSSQTGCCGTAGQHRELLQVHQDILKFKVWGEPAKSLRNHVSCSLRTTYTVNIRLHPISSDDAISLQSWVFGGCCEKSSK